MCAAQLYMFAIARLIAHDADPRATQTNIPVNYCCCISRLQQISLMRLTPLDELRIFVAHPFVGLTKSCPT